MVLFDMSWFPDWYHHNLSHQILGVVLCTSVRVLEFRYHMKLNIASSPSIHSIHRQLCKKFDKTTINPGKPFMKIKTLDRNRRWFPNPGVKGFIISLKNGSHANLDKFFRYIPVFHLLIPHNPCLREQVLVLYKFESVSWVQFHMSWNR